MLLAAEFAIPQHERPLREPRVHRVCRVEIAFDGGRICGTAGNLSRNGIYVRTESMLARNERVEVAITIDEHRIARLPARVAHFLTPAEAIEVGRRPGIGLQFVGGGEGRLLVRRLIDETLGEVPAPEPELPRAMRVLVADDQSRLLDRLATVLGEAGFVVDAASDGAAAFASCMTAPPDMVIAAARLPLVDGYTLAAALRDGIERGEVAFLLLSDGDPDPARFDACGLDLAENVLEKPFTDGELLTRLRQLAHELA